jgi:hypothetical protein
MKRFTLNPIRRCQMHDGVVPCHSLQDGAGIAYVARINPDLRSFQSLGFRAGPGEPAHLMAVIAQSPCQ